MIRFGLVIALNRAAMKAVATVVTLCSIPVQAECIGQSDAAVFVPAKAAIVSWEQSRGIHVAPEQRDKILEQYCTSAKAITDELSVELDDVATEAQVPLWAYLDAAASPELRIQPIEALVQAQYSLDGSAWLPEIKAMGVVHITYSRAADAITLNGRRREPYPKFFAELGRLSIVGLSRGNIICSATLTVSAVRPVEFKC